MNRGGIIKTVTVVTSCDARANYLRAGRAPNDTGPTLAIGRKPRQAEHIGAPRWEAVLDDVYEIAKSSYPVSLGHVLIGLGALTGHALMLWASLRAMIRFPAWRRMIRNATSRAHSGARAAKRDESCPSFARAFTPYLVALALPILVAHLFANLQVGY